MSITGAPDGEGGRPTKVGVAISDVVTGMLGCGQHPRGARRPRSGLRWRRWRERAADRHLAARCDAGEPRQPGAERVRVGDAAGPPRQCPPEHRPVRDVRDGRRPDRRGRRVGASMAPVLRGRSGCPSWPRMTRFATNGDRVVHRAALRPILAEPVRETRGEGMVGAARGGVDPVRADQRRRRGVRLERGSGARHDRGPGAPSLGGHPAGRDPVPAGRHPGLHPNAAPDARRAHRRDPRWSSAMRTAEIADLRRPAGRLTEVSRGRSARVSAGGPPGP